tara:strand:- start:838 stop:1266 length:429 start_codon:yes stop_codon:yes gene_type:complete
MNKKEIISKINILVEMLYTEGQIKGLKESGEIFSPGITTGAIGIAAQEYQGTAGQGSPGIAAQGSQGVAGSDPHPSRGVKSWSAQSFTIKIHEEDDTIEFLVDGELKNRHQSNAAAIKFEQLLMQTKDQFASWNALDDKKDN